MKQKLALQAIALTTLLATQPAFANSKNFEGFHLGMQLDDSRNITEADERSINYYDESRIFDHTNTHNQPKLSVSGKYLHALGSNFILGVGATYDLTPTNGGKSNPRHEYKIEHKDGYSLYVAPGLAVTENTMVYGKLGMTYKPTRWNKESFDLKGHVLGLGVQHMLAKKVYLAGEFSLTEYRPHTWEGQMYEGHYKNTTNALSLEVGYKF